MPLTARHPGDVPALLDDLERLYDDRAARLYTRVVAVIADRAGAGTVMEAAFRQMGRLLARVPATDDLAAVLDLTVQQAITASPGTPHHPQGVAGALTAWRIAEVALGNAPDGVRQTAEADYVRRWIE